MHDEAFMASLTKPLGHGLHIEAESAPTAELYLPAGQASQYTADV
jgi:hypothetical protein